MTNFNKKSGKIEVIPYKMIEGGDNKYSSIAAASILAKVERDAYIEELCKENPELVEHYGIDSNKGYGSKKHMDGIKEHGITKWHRRSFGICKTFA
jgi:ribonuclease HII